MWENFVKELFEWLGIINGVILTFITIELIRLILIKEDWTFRFGKSDVPMAEWKKGLTVMGLFIILFPIINWFFVSEMSFFMAEKLGWYQFSLLFFMLPGVYLWITKKMMKLKWHKIDLIPAAIIMLDLAISGLVIYLSTK